MSKVLTDQIEKRTGGTAMDVPAAGKWPAGNIADDAVGTAQLSATGTASATTFLRGDNSWTEVVTKDILWQAVVTASTLTAVAVTPAAVSISIKKDVLASQRLAAVA